MNNIIKYNLIAVFLLFSYKLSFNELFDNSSLISFHNNKCFLDYTSAPKFNSYYAKNFFFRFKEIDSFIIYESRLINIIDSIKVIRNYTGSDNLNDKLSILSKEFRNELLRIINKPESWNYSFNKLKNNDFITILKSKDSIIRLFSWNDISYDCPGPYTFVQFISKNDSIHVQRIFTTYYINNDTINDIPTNLSSRVYEIHDIKIDDRSSYLFLSKRKMCRSYNLAIAQVFYLKDFTFISYKNLFDSHPEALIITSKIQYEIDLSYNPVLNELIHTECTYHLPPTGNYVRYKLNNGKFIKMK